MSAIKISQNTLKRAITTLKGSCHQGHLNIFPGESAGKQCVANCVMATIYATIFPVAQWNTKDVDHILHAGNRLYMKILKTLEYFQVTDIGNFVTKYGQRYNIEMFKEMLGMV